MSWIVRVALLLCLLVPIYSYSLYGVAAEWGPNKTFMYFTTVKIDRTTGAVTNLTTDGTNIGFEGSLQGVSAFDEKEARFMYVTWPGQGPIKASDVVHKQIVASLTIGPFPEWVFDLSYDDVHGKLYVLYQNAVKEYILLEIGPLTVRYLLKVPVTMYRSPFGAMDDKSGTYFLITAVTNTPLYQISSVDVATGQVVRTVLVDNKACPGQFMSVEYDNTTDTLLGGGRSATEYSGYFFFRVDPTTGKCIQRELPIPEMVANWAYDSRSQELLYIQDDTPGQKLGTYNIKTNRLSTPVLLRGIFYMAAMEVSLLH